MNGKPLLLVLTSSLAFIACQSKPVLPVAAPNPPVAAVQENVATHKQQYVTWGGSILETQTQKDQTEIVVLSKRLTSSTRPVETDKSQGRFIARLQGFHDPAIFKQGRELTVYGKVINTVKKKIGDYEYVYPVVEVERHHLWPVRIRYDDDDYYWHDPWYGPWYHPYPHFHHHRSLKEVK